MTTYEIPSTITNLYRHWEFHTRDTHAPQHSFAEIIPDIQLRTQLVNFIHERITIWNKRQLDAPRPYTTDPILQNYRFCNILRECDRQTIHFHRQLAHLRDDFPLWLLNMFYLRMIARTETTDYLGLLTFDTSHNATIYHNLLTLPSPKYGTPYIFPISVIARSDYPTRELFITRFLPTIITAVASAITTHHRSSVRNLLTHVISVFGYNLNFLWTEVLIDVAYQYPDHIDLYGAFPIGPGSIPTMRRLNPAIDAQLMPELLAQSDFVCNLTYHNRPITLSAENWEGVGCEFRKYTNLLGGRGRRRLY